MAAALRMIERPRGVVRVAGVLQFFVDRKTMWTDDLQLLPNPQSADDRQLKGAAKEGVGCLDVISDGLDLGGRLSAHPGHARTQPLRMVHAQMKRCSAQRDAAAHEPAAELGKNLLCQGLVADPGCEPGQNLLAHFSF